MNLRTLSIAVALALLGVFTLLNWGAFLAPTTLSLGFAEVQAPLGLVMLGVTGVVSGLFLVYILFQQASVIMESRRTAKELKAHRELADKAEASRFTEMRTFLEGELRSSRPSPRRRRASSASASTAWTATAGAAGRDDAHAVGLRRRGRGQARPRAAARGG